MVDASSSLGDHPWHDVASVVVEVSPTPGLAALSATNRSWLQACATQLEEAKRHRTAQLAKVLHDAVVRGPQMSVNQFHGVVHQLPLQDRILLAQLADNPQPLLSLQSEEARLASWLLMRLIMDGSAHALDR